jgi:hypothetical protein
VDERLLQQQDPVILTAEYDRERASSHSGTDDDDLWSFRGIARHGAHKPANKIARYFIKNLASDGGSGEMVSLDPDDQGQVSFRHP